MPTYDVYAKARLANSAGFYKDSVTLNERITADDRDQLDAIIVEKFDDYGVPWIFSESIDSIRVREIHPHQILREMGHQMLMELPA